MDISIDETYGPAFIGLIVMSMFALYGDYLSTSALRLSLIQITNYGRPIVPLTGHWTLFGIIALFSKLFFTVQIFHMSSKKIRWWLASLVLFTIVPLGAFGAISDFTIASSLCALLHGRKSNIFSSTHKLLTTLIVYAINRCILTSVFTIAAVIAFETSTTSLWFLAIEFIMGKLYANSFLASLNSRNAVREVNLSHPRGSSANIPISGLGFEHNTTSLAAERSSLMFDTKKCGCWNCWKSNLALDKLWIKPNRGLGNPIGGAWGGRTARGGMSIESNGGGAGGPGTGMMDAGEEGCRVRRDRLSVSLAAVVRSGVWSDEFADSRGMTSSINSAFASLIAAGSVGRGSLDKADTTTEPFHSWSDASEARNPFFNLYGVDDILGSVRPCDTTFIRISPSSIPIPNAYVVLIGEACMHFVCSSSHIFFLIAKPFNDIFTFGVGGDIVLGCAMDNVRSLTTVKKEMTCLEEVQRMLIGTTVLEAFIGGCERSPISTLGDGCRGGCNGHDTACLTAGCNVTEV
ncbi:hypothetical protein BDQ12DRAFT_671660 [Crucibulum laeve]|uniref:DUF6534 domain-containing protein n=1 Tax=Crucibulum laeve TaxID=68775 RepID=A0A5C3LEZ0_9AGAR|nr:hypothetical protein BDQ12DRAFT_671660 [Crucibulum laeve]